MTLLKRFFLIYSWISKSTRFFLSDAHCTRNIWPFRTRRSLLRWCGEERSTLLSKECQLGACSATFHVRRGGGRKKEKWENLMTSSESIPYLFQIVAFWLKIWFTLILTKNIKMRNIVGCFLWVKKAVDLLTTIFIGNFDLHVEETHLEVAFFWPLGADLK